MLKVSFTPERLTAHLLGFAANYLNGLAHSKFFYESCLGLPRLVHES